MNIKASFPKQGATSVPSRQATIAAEKLAIDIPVYDVTSRSLRHVLMLNPIASAFRGASHVGGAIAMGARGIVVVRAIDSISFEIKSGERVGLIGHNGAGKTTLLRTLAGIYEPTGGRLQTAGRIMPLFNLMEGMMPDATGREFVQIRAILLGLQPKEIDAMAAGGRRFLRARRLYRHARPYVFHGHAGPPGICDRNQRDFRHSPVRRADRSG